jgi:monoamine oxidase
MERLEADVAIVGAGFAGLTAATRIARGGRSVVVLEARDRVGGRVLTEVLPDGTPVDLGGQWIGPGQRRMYSLAERHKIPLYKTYGEGKHVLVYGGKKGSFRGTVPILPDVWAMACLGHAWYRLDALATKVPLDAPWEAPQAAAWDSETLESFLCRSAPSEGARKLLRVAMETVLACDPADVSLLHALFYVRSAGKLDRLLSTDGGAQQDRMMGGVQPLAEKLCASLGNAVRLGQPVRAIAQSSSGVIVTAESTVVSARRAIVALPPTLAGRIAYDPPMPAGRDQLTQRVPQGTAIKCLGVYETPFWRADGLTGQAVSDEGPVHVTFDASPAGGRPGVLMGFIEGNAARRLASAPESERRAAVLRCFGRYFGHRADRPIHYVDKAWSEDPWSRGCYAGYFPTGVWTSFGKDLREPVGRIHWAGTETATEWNGYIEGAVQSGERAAEEVLRQDGCNPDGA